MTLSLVNFKVITTPVTRRPLHFLLSHIEKFKGHCVLVYGPSVFTGYNSAMLRYLRIENIMKISSSYDSNEDY